MANKFVRSMNDVNRKENELPLDLTNENDLISTKEKQHHIRRKDDYHCLTDNVKTIKLNGKELKPDLIKNQVTSPNLAEEVNGVKVSNNGKVTIDTGVMTVNGQEPDSKGDIVVSSENLQIVTKLWLQETSEKNFVLTGDIRLTYIPEKYNYVSIVMLKQVDSYKSMVSFNLTENWLLESVNVTISDYVEKIEIRNNTYEFGLQFINTENDLIEFVCNIPVKISNVEPTTPE